MLISKFARYETFTDELSLCRVSSSHGVIDIDRYPFELSDETSSGKPEGKIRIFTDRRFFARDEKHEQNRSGLRGILES